MQSIVSNSEIKTLKEMIFQRISERNKNDSADFQFDILNDARESIENVRNPFKNFNFNNTEDNAEKIEQKVNIIEKNDLENKNAKPIDKQQRYEGLGFNNYANKLSDLQMQKIKNYNQEKNQLIASEMIKQNMFEAGLNLRSSSNFVGALAFLNANNMQLYEEKISKFEIVA